MSTRFLTFRRISTFCNSNVVLNKINGSRCFMYDGRVSQILQYNCFTTKIITIHIAIPLNCSDETVGLYTMYTNRRLQQWRKNRASKLNFFSLDGRTKLFSLKKNLSFFAYTCFFLIVRAYFKTTLRFRDYIYQLYEGFI